MSNSVSLDIQGTPILEFNLNSKKRFLIHEGGSRSGKTYANIQYIILYCFNNTKKVISVCRKSLPSLKATAFRDFKEIMELLGLYDESFLNKTEMVYNLNGNTIEFISIDQPQKVRGRKRHILFINEANEITLEDFRQLDLRTTEKIIIDYNPSDSYGWHYDIQANRFDDVDFLRSTYKDNTFLDKETIRTIESYKDDPEFWSVFGLGQKGKSTTIIYPTHHIYSSLPAGLHSVLGIDFGYNNKTAVIRSSFAGRSVYCQQLLYESYLTSSMIAEKVASFVLPGEKVYCDAADPDKIFDLRAKGIDAVSADKEVKKGIDAVKEYKLHYHKDSYDLIRESQGYKWKTNTAGQILDEPVKLNDHLMDAKRYAIYNHHKHNKSHGKFDYEFYVV